MNEGKILGSKTFIFFAQGCSIKNQIAFKAGMISGP
jgi:hypothetical protein